ncbi:hypothetical protein [Sphaerisporangium perillae]|nr:hypothetical protein [Sphaerisporangium perillae]
MPHPLTIAVPATSGSAYLGLILTAVAVLVVVALLIYRWVSRHRRSR